MLHLLTEAIAQFVIRGDRNDNGAGAGWAIVDMTAEAVVEIRPTLGDALATVDMVGGAAAGYSICPADHAAALPRI